MQSVRESCECSEMMLQHVQVHRFVYSFNFSFSFTFCSLPIKPIAAPIIHRNYLAKQICKTEEYNKRSTHSKTTITIKEATQLVKQRERNAN